MGKNSIPVFHVSTFSGFVSTKKIFHCILNSVLNRIIQTGKLIMDIGVLVMPSYSVISRTFTSE